METKNVIALVFCISNIKLKLFHSTISNVIQQVFLAKLCPGIYLLLWISSSIFCQQQCPLAIYLNLLHQTLVPKYLCWKSSLGAKIFTNFSNNKMTLQSFPSREIEGAICWVHFIFEAKTVKYFQISNLLTQFKQNQLLSKNYHIFFYFLNA